MKLYNTLSRKVETLKPIDEQNVRIYTCGPTVYDHAHIGNLAAYIFADTLHRTLAMSGYHVTRAMNYTDIDDKTVKRSCQNYPELEAMQALEELTTHYTQQFLEDMKKIGNDTSNVIFVRATDYIEPMKQLIAKLHEQGFAYVADDGVYFSIEAYKKSGKTYGQLLKIDSQNTSQERIQNDEYDKASVHDFALWKTQKPGEPAWEFKLDGKNLIGRPGWHIECSAMTRSQLGQPFDIHTGGVDNVFPHHENEIAQSTAGEKSPIMATMFVHCEHLLVDSKKMAKSAHNFYTIDDIIAKGFDPLAFRLLILQSHYHSQAHFSWENLEAAQNRLNRIRAFADLRLQPINPSQYEVKELDHTEYGHDILSAMQSDLSTPKALEIVSKIVDERKNGILKKYVDEFYQFLRYIDSLFGLKLLDSEDISSENKVLIRQREVARQAKNWEKSDELRDQLKQQGVGIRDTDHGPIWYREVVV